MVENVISADLFDGLTYPDIGALDLLLWLRKAHVPSSRMRVQNYKYKSQIFLETAQLK